jgi:hypothetical protein
MSKRELLFLRISHGASRLQEILADRHAALAYGGEAFAQGLKHVVLRDVHFDGQAELEVSHPAPRDRIDDGLEVGSIARHEDTELECRHEASSLEDNAIPLWRSHPLGSWHRGVKQKQPSKPGPGLFGICLRIGHGSGAKWRWSSTGASQ